jgi:hypothetical protein
MTRHDLVRALETVATRLKGVETDGARRAAAEIGLEQAALVALGPGFDLTRPRAQIMNDILELAVIRGEASGISGKPSIEARSELLEKAFEQELPR